MSEPTATFAGEFETEFQTAIAALVLRDSDFNHLTEGLLLPEFFENEPEANIVGIILDYFKKYRRCPEKPAFVQELKEAIAAKKIRKDTVDDLRAKYAELMGMGLGDVEKAVESVAKFARKQALTGAILQSAEILLRTKGGAEDFEKVEGLVKKAGEVGATETTNGVDYGGTIVARTEVRKDLMSGMTKPKGIPTGIRELDNILFHKGWGRAELSCYMGGAKSGKTTALIDHAQAAASLGFKVLYVTLEVSPEIVCTRLDSNISEVAIKELGMNPHEVQRRVQAYAAKAAPIQIEGFPTGSLTPKELGRLLKKHKSKGKSYDLVCLDYADLMAPTLNYKDERVNLKSIYIDLRALAQEFNVAMLTATQTNREGYKAATATATHIAEDFNKVRTVDLLISINKTEDERARGEARLYLVASRNQEDGISIRIKQALERAKFAARVLGVE